MAEYSYNGAEQQAQWQKEAQEVFDKHQNFKKNTALFKEAYKTVRKSYTILNSSKKEFKYSLADFIEFVLDREGDQIFTPIWEKFGGEYEELADQYFQGVVLDMYLKDGTKASSLKRGDLIETIVLRPYGQEAKHSAIVKDVFNDCISIFGGVIPKDAVGKWYLVKRGFDTEC